jgi:hypothetical protein
MALLRPDPTGRKPTFVAAPDSRLAFNRGA